MALALEDFSAGTAAGAPRPRAATGSDTATATETETAERTALYEQAYKAGWDDAAKAEAEDQTRIGADLARSLQELSFTFHEARAQVVQSMEPLLTELTGTLLPALVAETLGARIQEELQPLIANAADVAIELVVSPAARPAVEHHLSAQSARGITIREEPTLGDGQAYLRAGRAERLIDLDAPLDRIREAIRSLYALNERTLKHG